MGHTLNFPWREDENKTPSHTVYMSAIKSKRKLIKTTSINNVISTPNL